MLAPSPLFLPSWLKFTLPVVRLPSQRLFISRRAARTPPLRHSAQRQIHFIGNADRIQSELEPNQVFFFFFFFYSVQGLRSCIMDGWVPSEWKLLMPYQATSQFNCHKLAGSSTRLMSLNKILNFLLARINKHHCSHRKIFKINVTKNQLLTSYCSAIVGNITHTCSHFQMQKSCQV